MNLKPSKYSAAARTRGPWPPWSPVVSRCAFRGLPFRVPWSPVAPPVVCRGLPFLPSWLARLPLPPVVSRFASRGLPWSPVVSRFASRGSRGSRCFLWSPVSPPVVSCCSCGLPWSLKLETLHPCCSGSSSSSSSSSGSSGSSLNNACVKGPLY